MKLAYIEKSEVIPPVIINVIRLSICSYESPHVSYLIKMLEPIITPVASVDFCNPNL